MRAQKRIAHKTTRIIIKANHLDLTKWFAIIDYDTINILKQADRQSTKG